MITTNDLKLIELYLSGKGKKDSQFPLIVNKETLKTLDDTISILHNGGNYRVPVDILIEAAIEANRGSLLFRWDKFYEDLWSELSDESKAENIFHFILEGDAPIPPTPDGPTVTIQWDFHEFSEAEIRDADYKGLLITNNNRNPKDYIDSNGIHWSLTSRNNARYAKYTPTVDGVIKIYFTAYEESILNAICAIGKVMVIDSNIDKLYNNALILGANNTNGQLQAITIGKVKKDLTIYIYSANKGINIQLIEFTYKQEGEPTPPKPTDGYTIEDNTLVGVIDYQDNIWSVDGTFESNTLILQFGTPDIPTKIGDLYIEDGMLVANNILDNLIIVNNTIENNTIII